MAAQESKTKVEMKKGPWTRDEDQKLLAFIREHGHGSWRTLPEKAGLERCGKSCRLRWTNYLRPDIKRGKFSNHEEKTIIRLHALLGNRWSIIAAHLPKRTDNEIKNYWNTRLKKRLTRMGIDPTTHKPKNNPSGSAQSKHAAILSHMAQWETTRLEAEARLSRESKLVKRAAAPPPRPQCLDVLKVWQSIDSTLNFFSSTNNPTVPTVISSLERNDVVPMNNNYVGHGEVKGKMENSLQIHENDVWGYELFNHGFEGYNMIGPVLGEYEDINYWNSLLDLVMESPTL